MPDENLTAALRQSLKLVENNDESTPDSPLREATTDSVDILLDRINQHLAAGMPELVSDEMLMNAIEIYRSQALRWAQEEDIKSTKRRTTRSKKESAGFDPSNVVDIDLLS